jgi:hypothetical protein
LEAPSAERLAARIPPRRSAALVAVGPVLQRVYSLAAARSESAAKQRSEPAAALWDTQTLRFLYVSPSVELLRGNPAEEVMAEPMDAALTPAAAAFVRDLIALRVAEFERDEERELPRRFYTEEVEHPCKDGAHPRGPAD